MVHSIPTNQSTLSLFYTFSEWFVEEMGVLWFQVLFSVCSAFWIFSVFFFSAHGNRRLQNWKHGAPVKSLKANNALVADSLPKATSPACRALSSFIRNLLHYNPVDKSYPLPPTAEEHAQLCHVSQQVIMDDQQIFSPYHALQPSPTPTQLSSWLERLFLADLQQYGVTRFTFDWQLTEGSNWNRMMTILLVKHWIHSKKHGAFSNLPINPAHTTEIKLAGMIIRWIRGRAVDIRSGRNNPEKLRAIEKHKKKKTVGDSPFHSSILSLIGLSSSYILGLHISSQNHPAASCWSSPFDSRCRLLLWNRVGAGSINVWKNRSNLAESALQILLTSNRPSVLQIQGTSGWHSSSDAKVWSMPD